MPDASHLMGGDLSLSASGDVLLATGSDETTQRVLRRLLTNAGSYIWHRPYGAGFPAMVGQPARPSKIAAIGRAQMRRERGVSQTVPPTVTVRSDNAGTVVADISYVSADTGETVTASQPVA